MLGGRPPRIVTLRGSARGSHLQTLTQVSWRSRTLFRIMPQHYSDPPNPSKPFPKPSKRDLKSIRSNPKKCTFWKIKCIFRKCRVRMRKSFQMPPKSFQNHPKSSQNPKNRSPKPLGDHLGPKLKKAQSWTSKKCPRPSQIPPKSSPRPSRIRFLNKFWASFSFLTPISRWCVVEFLSFFDLKARTLSFIDFTLVLFNVFAIWSYISYQIAIFEERVNNRPTFLQKSFINPSKIHKNRITSQTHDRTNVIFGR